MASGAFTPGASASPCSRLSTRERTSLRLPRRTGPPRVPWSRIVGPLPRPHSSDSSTAPWRGRRLQDPRRCSACLPPPPHPAVSPAPARATRGRAARSPRSPGARRDPRLLVPWRWASSGAPRRPRRPLEGAHRPPPSPPLQGLGVLVAVIKFEPYSAAKAGCYAMTLSSLRGGVWLELDHGDEDAG